MIRNAEPNIASVAKLQLHAKLNCNLAPPSLKRIFSLLGFLDKKKGFGRKPYAFLCC